MKDENKNLDAFFSTRLQNETIGEDGWNMPPDDIWDEARTKFIDRKKPKRRFLFWLLIPFSALCLSIPLKLLEGSEPTRNSQEAVEFLQNDKNVNSIKNQSIKPENGGFEYNSEEKNNSESENSARNLEREQEKVSNQLNKKEETLKNQEVEKSNGRGVGSTPSAIIDNHIINFKNKATIISKDVNEIFDDKDEDKIATRSREYIEVASLTTIDQLSGLLRSDSGSSQDKISMPSPMVSAGLSKLLTPVSPTVYRNELGISHTQMLLNLLIAFDVQSDNGRDEYFLSNTYINSNVTGRKWINKKWSLTTGAQYFSLDLGINFSVYDTLDNDLSKFINEEYNEITSRSSIDDQGRVFVIDLEEGIDIQLGDELNIKGDVTQSIRAIQFPLFLDYHIYKRKWEYLFGFGVSVEYVEVTEKLNDFKLFRDDKRISKPVNLAELTESFIDGSVYVKSGIRYKISDQFNFGLDAKINLLGLPFSGLDAGFYYRWN